MIHHSHHSTTDQTNRSNKGYEPRDANVRTILLFAAALAVVLLGTLAAMKLSLMALNRFAKPKAEPQFYIVEQSASAPQPTLEVVSGELYRAVKQADDATLSTYGWVDQPAGVVRIPIERAMELTLERGLPSRRQ